MDIMYLYIALAVFFCVGLAVWIPLLIKAQSAENTRKDGNAGSGWAFFGGDGGGGCGGGGDGGGGAG